MLENRVRIPSGPDPFPLFSVTLNDPKQTYLTVNQLSVFCFIVCKQVQLYM